MLKELKLNITKEIMSSNKKLSKMIVELDLIKVDRMVLDELIYNAIVDKIKSKSMNKLLENPFYYIEVVKFYDLENVTLKEVQELLIEFESLYSKINLETLYNLVDARRFIKTMLALTTKEELEKKIFNYVNELF